MSYILDALRRAEADRERERGQVPGLHSQPVPTATPAARRSPWLWGVLALLGVAAAAAAGWWFGRAPTPTPAPTAAPAPVAAAAAPAVPAAVPVPAEVAAPAPAPAPQPAAPQRVPTPTLPPLPGPPPRAEPPRPPATAAVNAAGAPAAPLPASAPALATAAVLAYEQLPEDVKRQLPPLAIGGAIWSDQAASRMLIVGGQLLREGDAAAPGVTLETIKPRSAVLRWKTLRYEVLF